MMKFKILLFLFFPLIVCQCKVINGDSSGNFDGATPAGLRSEDFRSVIMPSSHPSPDSGTPLNVAVDTRRTYSVAFIVLIHSSLDTQGEVALRNVAKIENLMLHLENQFINSTEGKGRLSIDSTVHVISVPGPFYDVSQNNEMILWAREQIRDHFYSANSDDYDFLAVYTDYGPDLRFGSRALEVTPTVSGLGRNVSAYSEAPYWGSEQRLKAVGLITDVNTLPETYDFANSKMNLLLHELVGHHWGVFIPELTSGGNHFDSVIQAPTHTVMYARPWNDLGSGQLEISDIQDASTNFYEVKFHPWVLYQAGLLTKAEIPDQIMRVTPAVAPRSRYDIYTTTGSFEMIDIDDIITTYGDREDL